MTGYEVQVFQLTSIHFLSTLPNTYYRYDGVHMYEHYLYHMYGIFFSVIDLISTAILVREIKDFETYEKFVPNCKKHVAFIFELYEPCWKSWSRIMGECTRLLQIWQQYTTCMYRYLKVDTWNQQCNTLTVRCSFSSPSKSFTCLALNPSTCVGSSCTEMNWGFFSTQQFSVNFLQFWRKSKTKVATWRNKFAWKCSRSVCVVHAFYCKICIVMYVD